MSNADDLIRTPADSHRMPRIRLHERAAGEWLERVDSFILGLGLGITTAGGETVVRLLAELALEVRLLNAEVAVLDAVADARAAALRSALAERAG